MHKCSGVSMEEFIAAIRSADEYVPLSCGCLMRHDPIEYETSIDRKVTSLYLKDRNTSS